MITGKVITRAVSATYTYGMPWFSKFSPVCPANIQHCSCGRGRTRERAPGNRRISVLTLSLKCVPTDTLFKILFRWRGVCTRSKNCHERLYTRRSPVNCRGTLGYKVELLRGISGYYSNEMLHYCSAVIASQLLFHLIPPKSLWSTDLPRHSAQIPPDFKKIMLGTHARAYLALMRCGKRCN